MKITLGFWFDPALGQVKDSWQRQREVWNLCHAFCHPKRNQRRENPPGLYGLPGTVFLGAGSGTPGGGAGGGRVWGARGSRQPQPGLRFPLPHARSPRLPCAEAGAGGSGPFRPPRTLGLRGRRQPAAWGQPGSPRPPLPRPGLDPGPRTLRVGSRPAQGPEGPQSRGLNGEQVPAPAWLCA